MDDDEDALEELGTRDPGSGPQSPVQSPIGDGRDEVEPAQDLSKPDSPVDEDALRVKMEVKGE